MLHQFCFHGRKCTGLTRNLNAALRVLTRPDVQRLKLASFLEWCKEKLSSSKCKLNYSSVSFICVEHVLVEDTEGMTAASGVLATLASLFKLSKREDIEKHAPDILRTLKACNTLNSSNTLLRKLSIKLAQVGTFE